VDAGATAYRVVISWVIGCAVGVLIGVLMSRNRVVFYAVNPIVEALRPVPIIAFIPFTLLWFGLSDLGRIVLGVLVTAMIMIVSTTGAARNVSPVQIRAAQTLGATGPQVYRTVVLPAIFPTLVASLRVAAGFAWAVIVGAEFLGAQNGIGYLLLQASNSVDTAIVLVGTVVVGVEAFIFDQLLRLATNHFTRWVDRMSGHG
jgi:ABC-type nitrate/sulfonate/bicarbonate transport system permease component